MENISNSISYLKGLMEGLDIDTSSKEGKIFEAIMDVLDEINDTIDDLYDYQDELAEQVDMIDDDLAEIEEELIDCCEWTWTTLNGVNGYKVSSKAKDNDNSIFLPASGHYVTLSATFVNEEGFYWCANVCDDWSNSSSAFNMGPDKKKLGDISLRYMGQTIRPVTE